METPYQKLIAEFEKWRHSFPGRDIDEESSSACQWWREKALSLAEVDELHSRLCEKLRACVNRNGLGLAGENLSDIIIRAIEADPKEGA